MLIISLKEARKILGKQISDQMTDEQLEDAVISITDISRALLERASTDPVWKKEIAELAKQKARETNPTEV